MLPTRGYATQGPRSPLEPFDFQRQDPGPREVLIQIAYCGVCHTDIHQARGEWGNSMYPMVPGHEIVGWISEVGKDVHQFKKGDVVGVGCLVNSCRRCESCQVGEEQFCGSGKVTTYNGMDKDGKTPTYGGYSSQIVVDESFVLKVSSKLPLERVAPLLCAGITTYSPLMRAGVKKGMKMAIRGMGGLGHMAVKLAVSMGAEVTVISSSAAKHSDASKLGAHHFVVTKDQGALEKLGNQFDLILDAVSASHDVNLYLGMLKRDGAITLLGLPDKPMMEVSAFPLILGRRRLSGSLIGGIRETQEMLDYCAEQGIGADVEVIPIQKVNEAFERTIKGDVRYRFVIDMKSL